MSETNQTRSLVAAIIYFMMKYKWTALKSLEYLCSKKSDALITSEILDVLKEIEGDL